MNKMKEQVMNTKQNYMETHNLNSRIALKIQLVPSQTLIFVYNHDINNFFK